MSTAQNLEDFKRISTFSVSPTARYVASMARLANSLNIATLIELTGLPRSTIYRALSEVNDAVPLGCGSLIEYNRLTGETETKNICLTGETANENVVQFPTTDEQRSHIEERTRLTENPSGLSSTSEKIDPPLTPPSPVQTRSWEDDCAARRDDDYSGVIFENGKVTLVNGTRQLWLDKFGGDAEDLELALLDAAGTVQVNNRSTPIATQVQRRLAIIVRDRREKDKRYAAAVAQNRKADKPKAAFKPSRW